MALCRLRAARLRENSLWTAEKASENLSSPTCFLSSSISSWARFFSVGSGRAHRGRSGVSGTENEIISVHCQALRWVGAVTLICVGAVQLPVQWCDDGGEIRTEPILAQVHGDGPQELKHTCSLQRRGKDNVTRKQFFTLFSKRKAALPTPRFGSRPYSNEMGVQRSANILPSEVF